MSYYLRLCLLLFSPYYNFVLGSNSAVSKTAMHYDGTTAMLNNWFSVLSKLISGLNSALS